MIRKFMVVLLGLALVGIGPQAGLFKNSVDLADLSETSDAALESLKDTEFAVFLAQVRLNTAKAKEKRAGGAVKAANRTMEAEELDMKAAKAELKAAEANEDDERATVANARIQGAQEDIETARALRKWKEQEQQARQAEVAVAKSALDLAEARRDLARVKLLLEEEVVAVDKYDIGDFEKSVTKRNKEFDSANRKANDRNAKLGRFKEEWDRLAKNVEWIEED